jgi:hypothetical protein
MGVVRMRQHKNPHTTNANRTLAPPPPPDFGAPFADHERLRSPMRNTDLAATHTSLREHYMSSYNRVGE